MPCLVWGTAWHGSAYRSSFLSLVVVTGLGSVFQPGGAKQAQSTDAARASPLLLCPFRKSLSACVALGAAWPSPGWPSSDDAVPIAAWK